jgi:hypothetical protein
LNSNIEIQFESKSCSFVRLRPNAHAPRRRAQACLTDSLAAAEGRERATGHVAVLFGWYNALGSAATALGALASGFALRGLTAAAWGPQLARRDAERLLFLNYGLLGGLLACVYAGLSPACEARPTAVAAAAGGGGRGGWWRLLTPNLSLGLRRPESKFIVARLSALFALDAFAGSFVMQVRARGAAPPHFE